MSQQQINQIITALDHCRQTNQHQWVARCPAHDDKSPSLSIKELSDGRILIHCHAGCGANDVLDALGLRYDDLFPDNVDFHHYPPTQRRRPSGPSYDECLVAIAQSDRANGGELTPAEEQAELQAFQRLRGKF